MKKKSQKTKKKPVAKKTGKPKPSRTHKRLDVDFIFDFDYEEAASDVNDFKYASCISRNISSGGISFLTDFKIRRGALLKLKLWKKSWHRYRNGYIKPDWISAGEPKYVVGKVIRSRKSKKKYEIGIHFIGCNFSWFYYDEVKNHCFRLTEENWDILD